MTSGGRSGPDAGTLLAEKYALDAPLGHGGMAEVFRGQTIGAEGFRRSVAIKRVLAGISQNPAFAAMFVAEAKLSSRLAHPNIVSVLDFDRDAEGRLYLVMELVEGRDLADVLDRGRLPFSLTIYVLSEVLRGLGYAHDLPVSTDGVRGLIHRDISPHNVLVSWNGAVKLSDFGIAKARAATAASASITLKGKPAYMSPEQIQGAPLDGRSDLFAVGVMLWQMLTGQTLFAGGSTAETLGRVIYAPIPTPRSVAADVPAELEAIAMRLLARDRDQRYATAGDVIADLLRSPAAPRDGRGELELLLLARFPALAPVRTGQRQRAALSPTASADAPSGAPAWTPEQRQAMFAETRTGLPGPPAPAATPRRWRAVAAAGVTLIAAVLAGLVWANGRRDRPSGTPPEAGIPPAAARGADRAPFGDGAAGRPSLSTADGGRPSRGDPPQPSDGARRPPSDGVQSQPSGPTPPPPSGGARSRPSDGAATAPLPDGGITGPDSTGASALPPRAEPTRARPRSPQSPSKIHELPLIDP